MSKSKNDINKNMILVEAGRFEIGEKPNTKLVTISKNFLICKYPVTFAEYDELYSGSSFNKPKGESRGRGYGPVINVSWFDAIEYCNLRSKKDKLEEVYTIDETRLSIKDRYKWIISCNFDKNGYRLLTEAEWEFAARSGNKSKENYKYSGSNKIYNVAWYRDNSDEKTHYVGYKLPNELDIYDMSGNVWEWCGDWSINHSDFTKHDDGYDPKGPETGSERLLRGGSWSNISSDCQVSSRNTFIPNYSSYSIGFRVSRSL